MDANSSLSCYPQSFLQPERALVIVPATGALGCVIGLLDNRQIVSNHSDPPGKRKR